MIKRKRDKNWLIKRDARGLGLEPDPSSGLLPLTSELLAARGLTRQSDQTSFIQEKHFADLSDFRRLPDMAEALARVKLALDTDQAICVYGDYDADGMTAAAILIKALRALGHEIEYYIPDRINEGYGLNEEAVRRLSGQGVKLLITADCGVSNAAEVSLAAKLGLETIITDHHQPPVNPAELPQAAALVNPELMDAPGASRGLSGAGVSFALVRCLLADAGYSPEETLIKELVQLAAIGTVADGMPMLGDNRIITTLGLRYMSETPVLGIKALLSVAGIDTRNINEGNVAYSIAPRLNAAGRLDDPVLGLRLLLSREHAEANAIALKLEALNKKRQEIDNDIFQEIIVALDKEPAMARKPILILSGDNWHPGVTGITAARLMEYYGKPVVLVSYMSVTPDINVTPDNDDSENNAQTLSGLDTGKGSGRSLPGFDLHRSLARVARLLEAYGGHELACGLTIKKENFTAFKTLMEEIAGESQGSGDKALEQAMSADILVSQSQLTYEAISELGLLAPYGRENGKPAFVLTGMKFTDYKPIGQGSKHFRLFFKDLVLTAFSLMDFAEFPEIGGTYDLLFEPEINQWQGRNTVQYILRDLRVSDTSGGDGRASMDSGANTDSLQDLDSSASPNPYSNAGSLPDAGSSADADSLPDAGSGANTDSLPVADSIAKPDQSADSDSRPSSGWDQYRQAILDGRSFREKQIEALDALASGANTMLLMATGRGKTAVFQAAIASLGKSKISIVIYPLRSLARDQLGRMRKALEPFGLSVFLAWGGLDHWEKKSFFNDLYNGRIQLVITTAEFLQAHLTKFTVIADRLGLFVVDEAHHLSDKHRQAYKDLKTIWTRLGSPRILATTATADDDCARVIRTNFRISRLVLEDHRRENLSVIDARGGDKDQKLAYLLKIIKEDSKLIIYVNSRALTEELAEVLRDSLPWMRDSITYYHGGLLSEARAEREKAFFAGEIAVMVSTSAFGEGADIPDIRGVALYHLCFSKAEFNQLSGRAGRDGLAASIHLLYNKSDQDLNRLLLSEEAPDRDALGSFYLLLKEAAAVSNPINFSDARLAEDMKRRGYPAFSETSAGYCLGVLEEMDLLLRERDGDSRVVHFAPPPPSRLNLSQSSLFMEGQRNKQLFEDYMDMAFTEDLSVLLAGINRPILPDARGEGYGD